MAFTPSQPTRYWPTGSNVADKLPTSADSGEGVSPYTHRLPTPLVAVVAWNASSDKCHFMLSNTRRADFARFIIFTCLAFRGAQRGLDSFMSVEKLSVHRRTTTPGITISIPSLTVYSLYVLCRRVRCCCTKVFNWYMYTRELHRLCLCV